ncbi:MAG TPA: Sec-dependent nitrous-oxide reductase [Gemmatimonadales bacterium]|nr:Sec-dependent nitrous-oxide reductase [Gemmatimonadales bacterium]
MIARKVTPLMLLAALAACGTPKQGALVSGDAASRVYVAPGEYDQFYAFMSGGFSGQLTVYGLPSGRLLKTVPVFSVHPENGWGFTDETKAMLETSWGQVPWDDSHHPQVSQTDGVQDGRWVFINANNTPRIARIDLTRFETEEIIEIPNTAGGHASPWITPNTEYAVSATRFSVPVPNRDMDITQYAGNFKGMLTFVRADRPGRMEIAFQLLMPGFNYDIGHAGKAVSDGWMFFTTYNSEEAHSVLEMNASRNDKDFVAAVNWRRAEQCVADGHGRKMDADYRHNVMDHDRRIATSTRVSSVTVLDPRECEGVVFLLPTPKSPHGVDVDPTGEYIVASGKLATVIPVHSATKLFKAIEDKAFDREIDGIPVIKYEATLAGEVEKPGLGPLHTEFDGRGNAYTSMFISSEVVKWKLGTWEVLDRIPVYYSIGHLMIPGGDSRQPNNNYLVALNKITKDRYLPTGPELTQSAQLIDISGDKMQMLLDFPTQGEPHYAQAIPAELIRDKQVRIFPLAENQHPMAARDQMNTSIERRGGTVHVRMVAFRSRFVPDVLEGIEVGDTVKFHVTSIEQDWDVLHGFAILGMTTSELILAPGETRTLTWVPKQPGVFPFYCTDFCSALHQEMQGYARVSARGTGIPLQAWSGNKPAQASAAATSHQH